jgi:teichuronic acid biosynthesis glycosyltransferase TuaH
MEGQNFVITSLQTWELGIGTTIRNFALEISKKNKILYINTPIDQASWLRKKWKDIYDRRMDVLKKKETPVRKINENLWIVDLPYIAYSINKITWPFLFNYMNKINNKKAAQWIQKYLKEFHFDEYTLFIDTDIYRSQYLKEFLKPSISIYYRRDYIIGVPYWKKHGSKLEPILAAKSDIVMANSSLFCDELRQYNPNTHLLETGVNLELYDGNKHYETPADMVSIPKPIVGYVGSIYSFRLDEPLLCKIAEMRPEYSFVFTGPVDEIFKESKLQSIKNVYFTGSKKLEELPSYVAAFDVCTNPQIINDITIGNYPLKIDEYLAMGKPTVATKTHTMKEVFSTYVHLADSIESYLELIDKAIQEANDPQKKEERIRFALTHSWENRTKDLYYAIETYRKNN